MNNIMNQLCHGGYEVRGRVILTILFGIRGSVHALPFMLLSVLFTSGILYSPSNVNVGPTVMISSYIEKGITLFGLGLLVASLFVWITTWIDDYQRNYLPNWIIKDLYQVVFIRYQTNKNPPVGGLYTLNIMFMIQ